MGFFFIKGKHMEIVYPKCDNSTRCYQVSSRVSKLGVAIIKKLKAWCASPQRSVTKRSITLVHGMERMAGKYYVGSHSLAFLQKKLFLHPFYVRVYLTVEHITWKMWYLKCNHKGKLYNICKYTLCKIVT